MASSSRTRHQAEDRVRVTTVADVRRLGACCYCKRLAQRGNGAITIEVDRTPSGRVRRREIAHPKCYINHFGVARLIAYIPIEELETIRIGDVPRATMKAVLHRIDLAKGGR